jgi:hypothetical protein
MPKNPAPPRQVETRAGNKTVHPGNVIKPNARRSTAEVQAERLAKAQAKEDRELAKKRSIERVAQFERADTVREDDFNATPRPAFTPKPRPLSQTNNLLAESSDVEMTDGGDFDGAPFIPRSADGSVTGDDAVVESDPPPPAKKAKANSAAKGKAKVSKKAEGKAASKKKKAEESEVELVEPKAEPPKVPKPKKKSFREEINVAAKEFEEEKFGGGTAEPGGKPASNLKRVGSWWSQDTTAGGKKELRREGAIADICLTTR